MLLGIIGGMGPMATVYFYNMLTEHTYAAKDSDHINAVISSHATIPDRTDFILGNSIDDPAPVLAEDAEKLISFGAELLAIPCNTAHYFLPFLKQRVNVPFVDMVFETSGICHDSGCKTVGIMATVGTVKTGIYEKSLSERGINAVVPSDENQALVSDMIYRYIKAGKMPPKETFETVVDELKEKGADKIILGCTELSMLKKLFSLDDYFLDSLEVLALRCIERCGKTPLGFDFAER